MTGRVDARLAELGLVLPTPAPPAANYVPYVRTGTLVFISGQLPIENGKVALTGKLGDGISVADGQVAAKHCAINILAQLRAALHGDLDKVVRCVKLGAFVASAPGFTEHHLVVNGASNLIADVLGEAGKHARFAVGAPVLPLDAAVEIDAVFEVA